MVAAGQATVGFGEVWHRRSRPEAHEFSYRVNQIWIDPDRPEELFDRHPLWSHQRPSPVRFRSTDYGSGDDQPIGPSIRDSLEEPLGRRPGGPIRMLTQPRTWGWLFNPITLYLVWDEANPNSHDPNGHDPPGQSGPVAAVLEVTNTPWKERLAYPVALVAENDRYTAEFRKRLHVSPFLDEDYLYRLSISGEGGGGNLLVGIDVQRPDQDGETPPVVETRLRLKLAVPTTKAMTAALYRNPLPTHRVSLGIHLQAARLLRKRVPFVSHPKRQR